jgi:hypothetical protein
MSCKLNRLGLLICLIALALVLTPPSFGQNLLHQKDLGFAQVAVGGGYETVITLTNRGTFDYSGDLVLRRGDDGQPWNPTVDGEAITDGRVPVTIEPGQTITLRLTGDSVESGMAALITSDLVLDNFVEGNLTYFVRSGSTLTDSIGVGPSTETFLAAIPFEDFSAVALALANGDFRTSGAETASVTIRLFDDAGEQVDSEPLTLNPLAHSARFLSEIFDESVERGKIEISSDVPVIGTALTFISGQLSTLPMLPSPVAYTLVMVQSDQTELTAEMTLWAEGFFVKGYLSIYEKDGEPIENPILSHVHGQLIDGWLDLNFFTQDEAFEDRDVSLYMTDSSFAFTDAASSGSWVATFIDDTSNRTGTFEMTRTTD